MAKRRRQPDSDDAAAAAMAELNTLFVDTSLDTHLVMVVSSSDTVADFKKKVALEHKHCFPEIGEIQVHTVKVKRRLNFYHLPDIMLVWSAFHGLKTSWFLSVDASSIHTQLIKGSLEVGTNSGVKIGITNTDEDCRGFFSDANKNEILRLPLSDGAAEKNGVSEMIVGTSSGSKIGITNTDEDCRGFVSDANKIGILPLPLPDGGAEKKDVSEMIAVPVSEAEKPAEKLMDSHGNIYSEERSMGTKSRPKKKRKLRHTKDESHNCGLEGGGIMFRPDGKDGKSTMPDSIVKDMNDQFDVENKLVSEKASPPTTAEMTHLGSIVDSQNLKESNRKEEVNGFKSMMDFEPCQDVQADHSGGVSIMVPDSSARPANAGEDAKTSGSKRKKKKVRKTTAEIQDITNMAQIKNDERIKPTSETHKFDNTEEGKDFSLEQDRESIMPSNSQLHDAEKRNFRNVNSQKLLNSVEMKEENVLESKMNNGLDQDFPTMHSGGVITNMPDLSTRVMDVSGGVGDVNASGKRRKKKVQKITVEVQDTRDVEQIGKGEMKNPCAETKSEEKQEEKGLSFEHGNEVLLTPNSKAPDHVDPNLEPKETSFRWDADADAVDPGISSGTKKEKKKKKSGKKSVGTSIEKSGITRIHNGIIGSSGLPSSSTDHISKKSGKGDSIRHNEGNDYQLKLLDSSNHDALEKAQYANKKEADFVTKTQTEQTLEDVNVGNEKMAEKALVCHKDFPTGETEHAILETNQDDKYNENTENKSRKTPKKRKKEKHTATDVHEKIPIKGKQVGIEALATTETSIGFEHEGRHVGSSEVLPHKSEETVVKMHEIVVKNDELAENSGNGIEEILETNQDDKYNEKTENKSRKTPKKRKKEKHTATDVHEKIPIEGKQVGTEALATTETLIGYEQEGRHVGSSEVLPHKTEEMVGKMHEILVKNDELAENSANGIEEINFKQYFVLGEHQYKVNSRDKNKKNPSLDKSSSGRSETLPSNVRNQKSLSGLNGTNMMQLKTPKKMNLLDKSGAIFQGSSGESSGDENGIIHSDDSTVSPSDSSSMSGVSQNSTSRGSNDAEANSQRDMTKMDLSATTMDFILRNSKRFEKAKQLASQTQSESQPIEFVPDTQLT